MASIPTLPRAWFSDENWRYEHDAGAPQTITVHEPEASQKTGLLDARGNPLVKPNIRQRPGFKWSEQ